MKVIALKGSKDTGKSHVINIVYFFLLRDGYVQVPGHFRVLGNPDYEDFIDIIEKDQVKVGIMGMGDYPTGVGRGLPNLLDELVKKGCDVIVCACRDTPRLQNAVMHYPNHFFVNKTPSTGDANNRIVNVFDALAIMKLI